MFVFVGNTAVPQFSVGIAGGASSWGVLEVQPRAERAFSGSQRFRLTGTHSVTVQGNTKMPVKLWAELCLGATGRSFIPG